MVFLYNKIFNCLKSYSLIIKHLKIFFSSDESISESELKKIQAEDTPESTIKTKKKKKKEKHKKSKKSKKSKKKKKKKSYSSSSSSETESDDDEEGTWVEKKSKYIKFTNC